MHKMVQKHQHVIATALVDGHIDFELVEIQHQLKVEPLQLQLCTMEYQGATFLLQHLELPLRLLSVQCGYLYCLLR